MIFISKIVILKNMLLVFVLNDQNVFFYIFFLDLLMKNAYCYCIIPMFVIHHISISAFMCEVCKAHIEAHTPIPTAKHYTHWPQFPHAIQLILTPTLVHLHPKYGHVSILWSDLKRQILFIPEVRRYGQIRPYVICDLLPNIPGCGGVATCLQSIHWSVVMSAVCHVIDEFLCHVSGQWAVISLLSYISYTIIRS